jgi:hypothetical protein
MSYSGLTTLRPRELSYKVRVRAQPAAPATPQFLWGSAGIQQNIAFTKPIILHISNDMAGHQITFGTQAVSVPPGGPPTVSVIGSLNPGECVSIQINGFSGVFSYLTPPTAPAPSPVGESTVYCLVEV